MKARKHLMISKQGLGRNEIAGNGVQVVVNPV